MLTVENLCKTYESGFSVKNLSFNLEAGYILGFIGANGAGKTTAIKSIMNLVHPDGGKVTIFGKDMYLHETELKQRIGFTVGAVDFYGYSKIKKITAVYKRFYPAWNDEIYRSYLNKFNIDENKRVKELSSGMRVKLGITYALSYEASLLIFDEPTSGLDPVARDELLDLFREIVSNGDKSILFSTHITEDLDRCADYILFIDNGQTVAFDSKDDLLNKHVLVKGNSMQLEKAKDYLIGYKSNSFGFTGLTLRKNSESLPELITEIPDLQDIMVYYNRKNSL